METARRHPFSNIGGLDSPLPTALLVLLVAILSYAAPRLEGALMLHPQTVWPLWPSCALLVSVLVLVPRRIWPKLIPVAFAAIVLYDLQEGVPISSIAWFIPADTVEVLIAALCLRYFFDGVPRLNNVTAVAKYLFFAVILAPFAAAFLAAPGIRADYWHGWRICFLSEMLAALTLTPAILSWATSWHAWVRKSRAYHLEEAALLAALVLFTYLTFVASGSSSSPALLYSLVPCLLWSALRFGSTGVSTSMIVVTFLSIWGAVHGRGPFTGPGPFDKVLSLQLFLLFTATPFMILAALVEEHKRAEGASRESEERLRLAVQAGRMYAFEWDTATDVIVRSGDCADVFNWLDNPTRDLNQQFLTRVHPEDLGEYLAAETGLGPANPTYQTSYRLLRPDGSVIWLEESGHGYFDGQGRMLRTIGMVADITQRKRAEEALKKSEEKFSKAFRGSPTLVTFNRTRDGRYIEVNETFERIMGYRRDEVIGRTSSEIGFWDDPGHREKLVRKILVEGSLRNTECRFRVKGGDLRIGLLSADLIEFEGETCSICVIADITERKRAEEALRESEERLRLAVQAGRMYAFEWDEATDVIVRSGESAAILDWMEDPTRDTGRQFVANVHPDDREAYTAPETGLSPENPTYLTSYRVLRPDGSVTWLEARGHALFDDEGRKMGITGMVADVTERKLAEEALSSVSSRLIEAQEQERFRIARELHDDLSQRMALLQIGLGQFEQDTAGLSSKARQQLHNIAEVATEVSFTIHNLSHQLHPSNLDTLGLVVSLKGLCKEFSEQHNLQVQFVYDGIPGQIPKDVTLCLFRIVQEGLRNVVKHSGATEAEVELSAHGDRIELCISDLGVGFNTESARGAAGLGLISMRERLRLVGGDLTVESEPLHGTRIRVRTPLLTTSAQVTSEPKARKTGA